MFTIPNIVTLLNAFGGCLAIISIFSGQILWLPYITGFCLLADFADGLLARLLKSSSEIGKELDSLADVISFGVVPGAIFYYLINKTIGIDGLNWENSLSWTGALGFIISVFSALRLAKFNTDTRQSENFVGLNTPATTLFCLGLLLVIETNTFDLAAYLLQLPVLLTCIVVISFLLIAEIPIFSFKFKKMTWKGNEHRILFFLSSLIILLFLPFGLALMLIIIIYIISSLFLWITGVLKL